MPDQMMKVGFLVALLVAGGNMAQSECGMPIMQDDNITVQQDALKKIPTDMNVPVGTTVEFVAIWPRDCNYTSFTLDTTPSVGITSMNKTLANKDQQLNLTFVAEERHNGTVVSVLVLNNNQRLAFSTATLRVQGLLSPVSDLESTKEPDNCQNMTRLRFSWRAPFTLEGVPILFYTVNITGSNGQLLKTDTTTIPEYHYNASRQLQAVTFTVAAVNVVGIGNASNITKSVAISTTCTNDVTSAAHGQPTVTSLLTRTPGPASSDNTVALSVGIVIGILIVLGVICLVSAVVTVTIYKRMKRSSQTVYFWRQQIKMGIKEKKSTETDEPHE